MYVKIPFYGKKNSLRSIKKIGENEFRVEVYREDGTFFANNITISKEAILTNFLNDIETYLEKNRHDYELTKNIVDNDVVTKRCKKILITSLLSMFIVPFIAYCSNINLLFILSIIYALFCAQAIPYSFREITKKTSINNMKVSLKEYEKINQEKLKIEKELEQINGINPTVFSKIAPKEVELQKSEEHINNKIRKK